MDLLQTAERILATAGIHVGLQSFLALFFLAMARVSTAIYFVPFFGGQAVPGRVRAGLAVILAAVLAPNLAHTAPALNPVLLVALLAKEIMIGALMGIACQFVFYGIQMAGILIDTQRGMTSLPFSRRTLGARLRIRAAQVQTAIVLFPDLDGHLNICARSTPAFANYPSWRSPSIPPGADRADGDRRPPQRQRAPDRTPVGGAGADRSIPGGRGFRAAQSRGIADQRPSGEPAGESHGWPGRPAAGQRPYDVAHECTSWET